MKRGSLKRMLESADTSAPSDSLSKYPNDGPPKFSLYNLPETIESGAAQEIVENHPPQSGILSVKDLQLHMNRLRNIFEQNLRIRESNPNNPEAFATSEVDLVDQLKKLHGIAVVPGLYEAFTTLDGPAQLIPLLKHTNEDVGVEVLTLLIDLTDDSASDSRKFLKDSAKPLLPQSLFPLSCTLSLVYWICMPTVSRLV